MKGATTRHRRALLALAAIAAVAAVLAAAIPGRPASVAPSEDRPAPATQVPATTAPAPTAAPTSSPTPAASPEADVEAAWLVDVRGGSVRKLAETTRFIINAGFHSSGTELALGVAEGEQDTLWLQRFDLSGRRIERLPWAGSPYRPRPCMEIRSIWGGPPAPGDPPTLVEVGDRRFEGVSCGPISPNGRWMTYFVWSTQASAGPPSQFDQWAIDLTTGERRLLQQGLRYCGGCDSVPGPKWSASSRYLYFSDVVAGGDRFFLADVLAGSARQLSGHTTRGPFDVPEWSPVADLILYSNESGGTVMEDLAAGSSATLSDMPWPAAFDPSGTYVHSPGWVDDEAAGRMTVVFDVGSGRIAASLPGQPMARSFVGVGGPPARAWPIVATSDGFVAALQGVPNCEGTGIYSRSVLVTCVARASRPVISPDGTKVALARPTAGRTAPERCFPACFAAEIVVVDAATGRELISTGERLRLTLSYGRFTDPSGSASYVWSPQGGHLLVVGPPAR